MIATSIVLIVVFVTAFAAGSLAGPQYYGPKLLLLMGTTGILGGVIALLSIIAWRL